MGKLFLNITKMSIIVVKITYWRAFSKKKKLHIGDHLLSLTIYNKVINYCC